MGGSGREAQEKGYMHTHVRAHTHTHWSRNWQPTPAFLPGEFHGQRSLEGYSPWGHKESDTTKPLTHTHTHTHIQLIHFAIQWTLTQHCRAITLRFLNKQINNRLKRHHSSLHFTLQARCQSIKHLFHPKVEIIHSEFMKFQKLKVNQHKLQNSLMCLRKKYKLFLEK